MKTFRCAFLTKCDAEFAGKDDPLLAEELRSLGWSVEAIDWKNSTVCWSDFDLVLIRSPWDYYLHAQEFRAAISKIQESGVQLLHPQSIVEANIDKRYLADLISRAHPVVPTNFVAPGAAELDIAQIRIWCEQWRCHSIVVKPTISAGSEKTFLLGVDTTVVPDVAIRAFRERGMMVQPFVSSIQTDGEYSLVFLNGEYHHTIRKLPKPGDFRVQVQHGGEYTQIEPDEWLIAASKQILRDFMPETLYARVDWVRNSIGNSDPNSSPYLMMEVELIEPDLYLRLIENGIRDYARILQEKILPKISATQPKPEAPLLIMNTESPELNIVNVERPYEQLHPSSIDVDRWGGLIFMVIVSVIGFVIWAALALFAFSIFDVQCWIVAISITAFIGLLGYLVRMDPLWRFRSTRFREVERGFELHRGYLWNHRIFVPRERIQHTDVVQGPLMRRFKLASLVINTAGTHDHAISVEGLHFDRAEQLRASLLIKQVTGDNSSATPKTAAPPTTVDNAETFVRAENPSEPLDTSVANESGV